MNKIKSALHAKLRAANKECEVSNAYKNLQSDEERVIFTLKLMAEYSILPEMLGTSKNADESKRLRELANKLYITNPLDGKKCVEISQLYTKSIAHAPPFSRELALGYANRSAILLKMRKHTECLKDIDRALLLDNPENLKAKLYVRKTECLAVLKKENVAEYYNKTLCLLEKLSINEPWAINLKSKLHAIYDSNKILIKRKSDKYMDVVHDDPVLKSINPEVPCASDAVAIKYDSQFGRHIIATRDIEPGEVITIEKPYSWILSPDNFYTHCSNCLEVSWASIPCDYCTYALYCSEECKAAEWKKFHDIECQVFPALIEQGSSKLDLFSLRLAIQAVREVSSWQALKAELKEVDEWKDPRTKGFTKDGVFYSNKYRSLYSLTRNTEKRTVSDLFTRSLDSCFILYYVATRTKMFGEVLKGDLSDLLVMAKNEYITFFGGLILTHDQLIATNIHSFREDHASECVERGLTAMPFLSLTNHSCDANVIRNSLSNCTVIYSLYPIKKGEQIYDNYGCHYAVTPKEARQAKLLKQYYFMCNCEPCKKDWPGYFKLQSIQTLVMNPSAKQKILHAMRKFNKYLDLARTGDTLDKPYIIDDLLKMIKVLYDNAPFPCEEMNNVVETLKQVYALRGNRFIIPEV